MPQPHVDPSFSVSSLDSAPKITPFDSLTIILACRNRSRAIEARDKLLVFVDAELNKRRIQTGGREESEYLHTYGQIFRSKLELDFIPCDLASASSVLQFCETVQQRYDSFESVFLFSFIDVGDSSGLTDILISPTYFATPVLGRLTAWSGLEQSSISFEIPSRQSPIQITKYRGKVCLVKTALVGCGNAIYLAIT